MFDDLLLNQNLDSAHKNSWKTLYSNNSYDHIHEKQIYN